MWTFDTSDEFEAQYIGLGHDSELQKRVDAALDNLANAEKPQKLGEFKKSFGVFAYRVSDSCRIIYNVRYADNVIELIRVGDHKTVYGKD